MRFVVAVLNGLVSRGDVSPSSTSKSYVNLSSRLWGSEGNVVGPSQRGMTTPLRLLLGFFASLVKLPAAPHHGLRTTRRAGALGVRGKNL